MKVPYMLGALALIILLPLANSLNCTKYQGDYNDLCNNINPLELSEGDKLSLMQSNVYGNIEPSEGRVNLQLQGSPDSITLDDIYQSKISLLVGIGTFIFVNYVIFSILTKSDFIRKWLIADS